MEIIERASAEIYKINELLNGAKNSLSHMKESAGKGDYPQFNSDSKSFDEKVDDLELSAKTLYSAVKSLM